MPENFGLTSRASKDKFLSNWFNSCWNNNRAYGDNCTHTHTPLCRVLTRHKKVELFNLKDVSSDCVVLVDSIKGVWLLIFDIFLLVEQGGGGIMGVQKREKGAEIRRRNYNPFLEIKTK